MKEYVMGNGAIALGALAAGVRLVAGYPGTPSSEIIETVSKYPHEGVHLEWSVNEKAALEVAAAAAYSGARAMVTMKQMGLNVASDPLMSVAYVGVKGGLVIVSADDPGPISSQTEQDTRRFADFARIPVFDPSSPEEAFAMIQDAFECSEKYGTPVLFRPVTRVCHAYASIDVPEDYAPKAYEGFIKDTSKWVIFPRTSNINHAKMEKRNVEIGKDFSDYKYNTAEGGAARRAVVTSGISYAYVKECLKGLAGDTNANACQKGLDSDTNTNACRTNQEDIKIIRFATAFPFPEEFALQALEGVDEVLCLEELSPYLEEQILKLAGRHHLNITVHGKLDGTVPHNGENSVELSGKILSTCFGIDTLPEQIDVSDAPALPVRPPVLCAGCPHKASFYAVKQAMKGRKAVFCGDIGCYTLGNAMPLDMVDTCLCMGAGVTMAQGFNHTDPDTACFAFIGDSTFFASGMTGIVNAVYNEADITVCLLDNSTTAMTGHQPHPGTGRNMMGGVTDKIKLEQVIRGLGVDKVVTIDPFALEESIRTVREFADEKGVKVIIFKSPCIAITKPDTKCAIDQDKCIRCRKCIREIGCPALTVQEERVVIDRNLCTGCGLCTSICPVGAIGGER